jgi:hypothetical protein
MGVQDRGSRILRERRGSGARRNLGGPARSGGMADYGPVRGFIILKPAAGANVPSFESAPLRGVALQPLVNNQLSSRYWAARPVGACWLIVASRGTGLP